MRADYMRAYYLRKWPRGRSGGWSVRRAQLVVVGDAVAVEREQAAVVGFGERGGGAVLVREDRLDAGRPGQVQRRVERADPVFARRRVRLGAEVAHHGVVLERDE